MDKKGDVPFQLILLILAVIALLVFGPMIYKYVNPSQRTIEDIMNKTFVFPGGPTYTEAEDLESARQLALNGKCDEAKAKFESSAGRGKWKDKDAEIWERIGDCYNKIGKYSEAIAAYEEFKKLIKDEVAVKRINEKIDLAIKKEESVLYYSDYIVLENEINRLKSSGDYDTILSKIREYIAKYPDSTFIPPLETEISLAYLSKGDFYMFEGSSKLILDKYKDDTSKSTHLKIVRSHLEFIYSSGKDYDKVLQVYKKGLENEAEEANYPIYTEIYKLTKFKKFYIDGNYDSLMDFLFNLKQLKLEDMQTMQTICLLYQMELISLSDANKLLCTDKYEISEEELASHIQEINSFKNDFKSYYENKLTSYGGFTFAQNYDELRGISYYYIGLTAKNLGDYDNSVYYFDQISPTNYLLRALGSDETRNICLKALKREINLNNQGSYEACNLVLPIQLIYPKI